MQINKIYFFIYNIGTDEKIQLLLILPGDLVNCVIHNKDPIWFRLEVWEIRVGSRKIGTFGTESPFRDNFKMIRLEKDKTIVAPALEETGNKTALT